ncbi:MAG: hypothetical protein J6U04_07110 [Salinivirgaceae bacterium]|nr:hypothetical protein [Salinivirgaceae bacterium]
MKKLIYTLLLLLPWTVGFAEEIVLTGIYQCKNLYVMNPFAADGNGFCITGITVNGMATSDEINASAFEIDLSKHNLTKGDNVNVVIKHKSGCTPKVINPEVLNAQSTFTVTTIKIDKNNKLAFTTNNESGSLPFIVEQFRWNKWIKVTTIEGDGTPGAHTYTTDVNLHSGYNRFRVKQIDYTRKPRYGKELKHRSMQAEVTFSYVKPFTEIKFSAETMYEIYSNTGAILDKGIGTKVDVAKLPAGDYFLNYDTKTEVFKKK